MIYKTDIEIEIMYGDNGDILYIADKMPTDVFNYAKGKCTPSCESTVFAQ